MPLGTGRFQQITNRETYNLLQ